MTSRLFNAVVGATLVLAAALFPARAFAQAPAAGFEQLLASVRLGDEVWVKGHDGKEVKGKLTDVSPTWLEILSGGRDVAFGVERVKTISTREHDDLKNGARIGFYVGAGLGAMGAFSYCFGAAVDNLRGGCPGGIRALHGRRRGTRRRHRRVDPRREDRDLPRGRPALCAPLARANPVPHEEGRRGQREVLKRTLRACDLASLQSTVSRGSRCRLPARPSVVPQPSG